MARPPRHASCTTAPTLAVIHRTMPRPPWHRTVAGGWPAPCRTIPPSTPRPSPPWTPPPPARGHTPGWRLGPWVLQRPHQRGQGSAGHGAVQRPRASTPASQVAIVCGAAARATASGCPADGPDGRHTPPREGRCAHPLTTMARGTGAGPAPRPRGLAPRRAAGRAGRRWRLGSGGSGLPREASAPLDPGSRGPTAGRRDGARWTRWCAGTTRADTPSTPGRARRRSGGLSGAHGRRRTSRQALECARALSLRQAARAREYWRQSWPRQS